MSAPPRERPPLWSALRFEALSNPANREELKRLDLWRALGWHPHSALERLKTAEAPPTIEEEGRTAGLVLRLSELWARWSDEERALFWARYTDTERQPPPPPPPSERHRETYNDTPEGLRFPFELHLYQRRAVAFGLRAPRALFALEMGLGKTALALTLYHALRERGDIRGAIIAAPKSAHASWSSHLKHSTAPAAVLTSRPPQEREAAYAALYHGQLELVIITPTTLAGDYGYFMRLLQTRPLALIIDEAHKMKGQDTATGRAYEALSEAAARVVALTGTPSPNRAEGFYRLIDRTAPDILGSLSDFAARYTYRQPDTWSSTGGQVYTAGALRADRLAELYERLKDVLFIRTAHDQDARLELPPRQDLAPRVELDETQRQVLDALVRQQRARLLTPARYQAALEGQLGQLEQIGAEGATQSAQALGLRIEQTAISPALYSPTFDTARPDYESPKVQLIADHLTEHLRADTTRAALVCCEYLGGLEVMRRALVRRGFNRRGELELYTGESSPSERARVSEALNKGPARVLLAQTKAIETGANLQERADYVAHLSTPWAPDMLAQSTARVYRQGQRRPVIVLRPSGSALEEAKNRALTRKVMTAAQLTGALTTAEGAIIDTSADPRTRRAHHRLLFRGAYEYAMMSALMQLDLEGLT